MAFENGDDPYQTVAREVLGLVGADAETRAVGKLITLGLCFGMSAAGLHRELGAQLGRGADEVEVGSGSAGRVLGR